MYDPTRTTKRKRPTRGRRGTYKRVPVVCTDRFLYDLSRLESYRQEQRDEDMSILLTISGLSELNLTVSHHL